MITNEAFMPKILQVFDVIFVNSSYVLFEHHIRDSYLADYLCQVKFQIYFYCDSFNFVTKYYSYRTKRSKKSCTASRNQ